MDEFEDKESVYNFLDKYPEAASQLEEILAVDSERQKWTFHDVTVDTGRFGELVSSGIVESTPDGKYKISDRGAIIAVLEERTSRSSEYSSSISKRTPSPTPTGDGLSLFDLPPRFPAPGERLDRVAKRLTDSRMTLALAAIVLVGLLLRTYRLEMYAFWIDEVTSVVVAEEFVESGERLLPSGNEYLRSSMSTYLISLSIFLFGATEIAARLPFVLFGSASIVLVYLFARDVCLRTDLPQVVSLLPPFLLAISAFDVAWSRQARMYALFQFFFLAVLLSYTYFRRTRRKRFGILLAVTFVGLALTHAAWVLILPVLILDIVYKLESETATFRTIRLFTFLTLAIYVFIVAVFRHPVFPPWIYDIVFKPVHAVQLELDILHFFASTVPLIAIFGSIGTIALLWWNREGGSLVLSGFWTPLFIVLFFGQDIYGNFWPRYIIILLPVLYLLAAVGVYSLYEYVQYRVQKKNLKISLKSIIAVLLILFLVFSPNTPTIPNQLSEIDEPQPDYRTVAEIVGDDINDDDIVVTNRQLFVYYYMDRVPQYQANSDFVDVRSGEKLDFYTNSRILESSDDLRQVMEPDSCIWAVYNRHVGFNGEQIVVDEFSRVSSVRSVSGDPTETVYVFKWGNCEG